MPDVTLIVGLFTFLASLLGLLAFFSLAGRASRMVGLGLWAGTVAGGGYLGLATSWAMAAVVIGAGLIAGLAVFVFFGSGGSL